MKIPMVSKDTIKEYLFDTIGFKSRDEKVALGVAAMEIIYHFAGTQLALNQSIILENNFENVSKPKLLELIYKHKPNTLTICFHTEINALFERLLERDSSPERHRGHITTILN